MGKPRKPRFTSTSHSVSHDGSSTNDPLSPEQEDRDKDLLDFAWVKIIMGLVLLVATFWLHGMFTDLETGVRESVRVNWIIVLLYNTLGHIPTITILVLSSLGFFLFGIRQLIRERKKS